MIHLPEQYLQVDIARQELLLLANDAIRQIYPVSTAKNGVGQLKGSFCTPLGWHVIRAKIGEQAPLGAVFKARRPTGEIYTPALAEQFPGRDWILSRILWLGGLQPGYNRYGDVDTAWRYIYIHGAPDDSITGQPASHGCIRMRNTDIVDLFGRVQPGFKVLIR